MFMADNVETGWWRLARGPEAMLCWRKSLKGLNANRLRATEHHRSYAVTTIHSTKVKAHHFKGPWTLKLTYIFYPFS